MLPGSQKQFIGPQSVNLFITEFCNRKCPFCYLNNWITGEGKTAKYMTLEDIKTVIKWLKRSGIKKGQASWWRTNASHSATRHRERVSK